MNSKSINPATGELIAEFPECTDAMLEEKLAATSAAFASWKDEPVAARARCMSALASLLKKRAPQLGALATAEMGKPITQAVAEVEKCAWVCDYYATKAAAMLAPRTIDSDAKKSYIRFDPLGPILAVMPWNFPFWQVFRFAAPALIAGNTGVLKHASNVSQCALAIESLFTEAGFPPGVFQTLLISAPRVEKVLRDPRVVAVTLTGSEVAGRSVASIAGDEVKKSLLELGGSDPFIILADADAELVMQQAVMARLQNNGQSCISAKRYIIEKTRVDEFTELLVRAFEKLVIGDPMDVATQIGPLVNERGVLDMERQVNESVARGARVVTGGKRLERPGFFFAPTILADVKPGMPAYDEEVFGPVLAIISAENADEAVRIANNTRFGLGASLWTADIEKAEILASRIEAGGVFINGMVKSDPRLPFGGVKKSGYGRELSDLGLHEFVNAKTVWIR